MRVSFAPAFLRQAGKLDPRIRDSAKAAVDKVIDFYESRRAASGLLRGDFWEARCGLRIRVIYRLTGAELRFILVGTHDDVRQFLSGI